jgi:transposase IS116/IS110/IS902 family protein
LHTEFRRRRAASKAVEAGLALRVKPNETGSPLTLSARYSTNSVITEYGDYESLDWRQAFHAIELAGLAGACPSTRQSGKRSQAVFRWSCSKKLRAAVMDFANGSRLSDPWAAGIYTAAPARGCRHPHAIRILARPWPRIIWRCWQDGTTFDPALHRSRHLT